MGGLWEFPTGERQSGETVEDAVKRAAESVLGLAVVPLHRITRVRHAYSHFRIVVDVVYCRPTGGRVRRKGPTAHRWTTLKALGRYPMHRAHLKFLPVLREALGTGGAEEEDL